RHVRAGGIVRDHSADRRAGTGRDIRPETKSVRLEKPIELVEHDACADTDGAILDVEIVDFAVVAREIDDQPIADRVTDETRARAARGHRNVFVGRGFDHRARLLSVAREYHTAWLDLINQIGR